MQILIIEDEPFAAKQLKDMLLTIRQDVYFHPVIDTVEDAVNFFRSGIAADLVFLDIHLADGEAFEITDSVDISLPVIFTTAYDQYAIRAFEVNSVDYLLKPISRQSVEKAMAKYEKHHAPGYRNGSADLAALRHLLTPAKVYKKTILIPFKDKLLPVPVREFAWFRISNGVVSGERFDKTHHILDERSLDELSALIDPGDFFRANRKYLVNRSAIKEVALHFNGKLLASVLPLPAEPVIISREKAAAFREWLEKPG